jgi:hypothetical protein
MKIGLTLLLFLNGILCRGEDIASRYSNELPGYRFVQTAKWRSLLSPATTTTDVLNLMGTPIKDFTIDQSAKRSDGDDYLVRHLRFAHDAGWEVAFLLTLRDKDKKAVNALNAVRLYPTRDIDFSKTTFPPEFEASERSGAASTFILYSDPRGLTYRVHESTLQEEPRPPGTLISIEYRVR